MALVQGRYDVVVPRAGAGDLDIARRALPVGLEPACPERIAGPLRLEMMEVLLYASGFFELVVNLLAGVSAGNYRTSSICAATFDKRMPPNTALSMSVRTTGHSSRRRRPLYLKLRSPRRKDSADIVELVKGGVATSPVRRYLEEVAPDLVDKFDELVAEGQGDDE